MHPADFKVSIRNVVLTLNDASAGAGQTFLAKMVFGNVEARRTGRVAPIGTRVVRGFV